MIYAAIILLIAAVLYCHSRDWKENRETGRINHSKAFKPKILSAIPAGVLFSINLTGWPVGVSWLTALACGKAALLTGAWFLFLFNGYWGYRAKKDIFYRSTATGKDISRWDRLVLHWPKGIYIAFIILLLIISTTIYVYPFT